MEPRLDPASCLPKDGTEGTLIGRVWRGDGIAGPSVVVLSGEDVVDVTVAYPTTAHLLNQEDPAGCARDATARGTSLGTIALFLPPNSRLIHHGE